MTEETLYRYFKCETTPDEEQFLADWLDADPANHGIFEAVHLLFVRNSLAGKTAQQTAPTVIRPTPVWRTLARYAAGVAAVVLLIAGSAFLTERHINNALSDRMTIVEVPAGQRIRMTLEDGTSVWLNAGSRMEYPVAFAADQRRVKISGEALFEVTHNARRPFVVETFASYIEVLGTRFNVVAEESENRFSTALIEGSVKVTSLCGGDQITLRPDQTATLIDGHMTLGNLDDPTSLQWTEGIISLRGLSFAELMEKFEKAYDVQIIIARSQMPETDFTSGKIRISDGIDHALRILQHGAKFTYEKNTESNVITIR